MRLRVVSFLFFESSARDQTVRTLLNAPTQLSTEDVVTLAESTGMSEPTIEAIRNRNIKGRTWKTRFQHLATRKTFTTLYQF